MQRPQSLSLLAALAIVGQLVLAASALLLPIWSQYGLIHDDISELALGELRLRPDGGVCARRARDAGAGRRARWR